MVIYQVSYQSEAGANNCSEEEESGLLEFVLRHFPTKARAEDAFLKALVEGRHCVGLYRVVAHGKDAILDLLDDVAETYPASGGIFSTEQLNYANGAPRSPVSARCSLTT